MASATRAPPSTTTEPNTSPAKSRKVRGVNPSVTMRAPFGGLAGGRFGESPEAPLARVEGLDGAPHGRGAGAVAGGTGEAAARRPAAVAVHDDRDVERSTLFHKAQLPKKKARAR